MSRSKIAIKDLRLLQGRLVKAGKTAVMPSIPDSVGLAFGMPKEKAVEMIKNVQASLTELKSRYPKISSMQKAELYDLFFLSVTKLSLNKKQGVVGPPSDTYTIWDCLRDAYEELQRKQALEDCGDRCKNIWLVEQASLYATMLASMLGCYALIFPPYQVVCALAVTANWLYWSHKASKSAEECVEDCEELYS